MSAPGDRRKASDADRGIASSLAQLSEHDNSALSKRTRDEIADAITRLPDREKLVVALSYYEHLTLREIGEVLGVSARRVATIRKSAHGELAKSIGLAQTDGAARPALIGPDGAPLRADSSEAQQVLLHVQEIGEELIATLARKPELLYEIDPRRFEQLVAELYRRRGFEATLTPASSDGGADVYVVRHGELGRSLHVVQCKRYAAGRKVGPELVRELLGTIYDKRAAAGVLLTTSSFTPGARDLEQRHEHRLSLRDFVALREMLGLPAVTRRP
jgi:hypothetical protein